jgi:molybdenum cofactor cytidylyltransferase
MGDRNKLLEEVGGKPMVAHVVDALLATQARPVVVVVGHEADRVRAALAEREVRFVDNPEYAAGMSTSLRAGIGALLDQHVDGAFVALGDMPWVRPAHLEALGAAFAPALERSICVPVHQGRRGNPVLWAASYFPEMMAVEGDVGARALLRAHDDQLALVPVDDAAVHVDVDTPEDLVTVNGSRDPRPAGR